MIKIFKYYEGYDTQSYGCNISLPINLGFFGGKGRIGIIQNLSQTSTFLFLCADDANYAEFCSNTVLCKMSQNNFVSQTDHNAYGKFGQ